MGEREREGGREGGRIERLENARGGRRERRTEKEGGAKKTDKTGGRIGGRHRTRPLTTLDVPMM